MRSPSATLLQSLRLPLAMAVAASLALAACSSSSTPSPSGAPIVVPPVASPPAASDTPEPSTAEVSSAPASSGATAVPTAIDPCQLVTQAEASQFTGSTFGPGKESETPGHLKTCTYGGQTKDVFEVSVIVAPDVATAQAVAASLEAEAKAKLKNATLTDLSGLGDKAVWLEGAGSVAGTPIDVAAIYVLSGATAFEISDLVVGKSAPTQADFTTLAQTVLSRLPTQ